ncbi:pyroglutamyl-peptidase 1 [Galleria mellonella]|uniref:Pyroglutamyl-peptidase 1 n=1 Tax=Galleria mellonella TaxID=7137 RepID=A0A6J1WLU4_GALME|nr:pyroglutamyl-peptidase 1 [Galleria mellonella]
MCNELDNIFKPIVLVTGFGPFLNHPVNASWEAVKLMNKEEIEKKHNVELVQIEIPVTYENVDEFVPAIWETHEPKLMIHVGVSRLAQQLTLEMQAHKKGYQRLDYFDKLPPNQMCSAEGAMRLHTKLNVEKICKQFNDGNPPEEKTTAVASKDAGRYICEYTYYTSLSADNTRTLFVHVPDFQVYTSEQTARGLERILDLCMEQIKDMEISNTTNGLRNVNLSDNEENKV